VFEPLASLPVIEAPEVLVWSVSSDALLVPVVVLVDVSNGSVVSPVLLGE
jgi:hypothetical protein